MKLETFQANGRSDGRTVHRVSTQSDVEPVRIGPRGRRVGGSRRRRDRLDAKFGGGRRKKKLQIGSGSSGGSLTLPTNKTRVNL